MSWGIPKTGQKRTKNGKSRLSSRFSPVSRKQTWPFSLKRPKTGRKRAKNEIFRFHSHSSKNGNTEKRKNGLLCFRKTGQKRPKNGKPRFKPISSKRKFQRTISFSINGRKTRFPVFSPVYAKTDFYVCEKRVKKRPCTFFRPFLSNEVTNVISRVS